MVVSELRGRRGGDDPGEGNAPGEQTRETGHSEHELSRQAGGVTRDQQTSREDDRTPYGPDAPHETPRPLTAHEKLEQRLDEVYWPGYSRGARAEQRDDSTDRYSADVASRAPASEREDSGTSDQRRPREAQASEADSFDEDETADRQSSRPLTAREKLEQRLDEMYWPGYSTWSSTEQGDDELVDRRPVDAPSARARTPVDDRSEPEDPFASYSPELQAHMRHDDTLARLQYLSPPDGQAESTSQQGDSATPVESRDSDNHTSVADLRDTSEVDGSAVDDGSSSTHWLANEEVDQAGVDQPRRDDPPNTIENAEAKDRKQDVDEDSAGARSTADPDGVAAGTDSAPEPVADADANEPAEVGHEFVEDASTQEMDQYRRIRDADDLDALAENSGLPREVIDEAKQHLFQRQHDVAVGPGDVRHGYFTPYAEFGDLWERVASGDELTDEQRLEFRSLLAHEYVESKLMQAGVPYKSADSEAWTEDGMTRVVMEYPSAHNIAPLSAQSRPKDLLRLWDDPLGLPRGDLRVAEDLSNLDEVVRVAKEGLGL
jgi:hypothetical protein